MQSWWPRLGLTYEYALNWVAIQVNQNEDDTLCLANNNVYRIELFRRCPQIVFSNVDEHLIDMGSNWGDRPIRTISPTDEQTFSRLVWVDPSLPIDWGKIDKRLTDDGQIYIIVGGGLSRFLAERRQTQIDLINLYALRKRLKARGFIITEQMGIHGWRAISWHLLSTLAARINYIHWQERCHLGMRRAFIETGWGQWLTALNCLIVERR